MPRLFRISDTLEMIVHGQGTVEFRRGKLGVIVITFTELPLVLECIAREIKTNSDFDIDSPIVDKGVEALFGQHPERGGVERRQAVFAVLSACLGEIKKSRLASLTDKEVVVVDIALSEDEGNWHDEEKELIRQKLVDEFHEEVERRNLIPDE